MKLTRILFTAAVTATLISAPVASVTASTPQGQGTEPVARTAAPSDIFDRKVRKPPVECPTNSLYPIECCVYNSPNSPGLQLPCY